MNCKVGDSTLLSVAQIKQILNESLCQAVVSPASDPFLAFPLLCSALQVRGPLQTAFPGFPASSGSWPMGNADCSLDM